MNKAAFLKIVRQVSPIQDQDVDDLEKLVVSFPYCQTAHVLLAKAAHDRGSMLSNQKLRKAAAHVSNRLLLKRLVYQTESVQAVPIPETEPLSKQDSIDPENAVLGPFSEKEAENASDSFTLSESEGTLLNNEDLQDASEIDSVPEEVSEPLPQDYFSGPNETLEPELVKDEDLQSSAEDLTNLDLDDGNKTDVATSENQYLTEPKVSDVSDIEEVVPELDSVKTNDEFVEEICLNFTSEDDEIPDVARQNEESLTPDKTAAWEEEVEKLKVPTLRLESDDELQDLIQINSLISFSLPIKGVDLTRQEVLSEVVSSLEEKQLHGNIESADSKIAPSEDTPNVLVSPEIPQEGEESTADTTFQLEAPYSFPTLQIAKHTHSDPASEAPENSLTSVYTQNSLAYRMSSSRLGESLQLKDEWTTALPQFFQPELIIEHVKSHDLIGAEASKPALGKLDIQLDIINQFLKATPRRKTLANAQQSNEPQEDLSAKGAKNKKTFVSENLAQIMVKQGKIKKALKIYDQLIVKYPEKKSYFAQEIEKLSNKP